MFLMLKIIQLLQFYVYPLKYFNLYFKNLCFPDFKIIHQFQLGFNYTPNHNKLIGAHNFKPALCTKCN